MGHVVPDTASPLPFCSGRGECGPGDTSPTPQSQLLRAGFVRCGGGTTAPGVGAWCLGKGCLGWRTLHLAPTRPVRAPMRIAARHTAKKPPFFGAGGRCPVPVFRRAWRPITHPTAHALASWLRALWGQHEGARRGAPPALIRRVRGLAPSLSLPPILGAGGRGLLPIFRGRGGRRCGDLSPTPQHTLLQAGFARCGGSTRAPGGGRLVPGLGVSVVGHPPFPDSLSLGQVAGARCPCSVGAAAVGVGIRPQPNSALWGQHEGAWRLAPRA